MKTPLVAQVAEPAFEAPAPDAPSGGGGILGSPLLFVAAMLLLMYALMIRPQQRREKEHKQMLGQIERGDLIVTSGGIHGKVTGVADDVLTVEIATNVRIKISKAAVTTRLGKAEGEKS